MRRDADIGLADLVKALEALEATGTTQVRFVARALGFRDPPDKAVREIDGGDRKPPAPGDEFVLATHLLPPPQRAHDRGDRNPPLADDHLDPLAKEDQTAQARRAFSRPSGVPGDVLLRIAGIDPHYVTNRMDRARYTTAAVAMLVYGVIAAAGFTCFLMITTGGGPWPSVPVGVLIALVVMLYDRMLLANVNVNLDRLDDPSAPALGRARVSGYLVRVLIALLTAVVITHPLMLKLFKSEIDGELGHLSAIKLEQLNADVNTERQRRIDQLNPPIERNRRSDLAAQARMIATINQEQDAKILANDRYPPKAGGFLDQGTALWKVLQNSWLALTQYLLIVALIFVISLADLLIRLSSRGSPYDLAMADTVLRTVAEREIDNRAAYLDRELRRRRIEDKAELTAAVDVFAREKVQQRRAAEAAVELLEPPPLPRVAAILDDGLSGRVPLAPSWWEIHDAPRWLAASEPVPMASEVLGLPWPEPLLAPRVTDALIGVAVGRRRPGRDLDSRSIVEALARARIPSPLPHREHQRPARAAQVLVDVGEGMQPFATDQRDLVEAIQREVGADGVDVIAFDGCPLWGAGEGDRRGWRPYEPPEPDTVVIVASDLGLGGPDVRHHRPDAAEWRRWATAMTTAGISVVVFVPLPRRRWQEHALARVVPICEWDRPASVAGLVAALSTRSAAWVQTGGNHGRY